MAELVFDKFASPEQQQYSPMRSHNHDVAPISPDVERSRDENVNLSPADHVSPPCLDNIRPPALERIQPPTVDLAIDSEIFDHLQNDSGPEQKEND